MVSVTLITYNQEKYIAKALDSIINQKVNFKIEVLVGDDASSDNTPNIVLEYAKKFPDLIKAYCRKENLGATRNWYELGLCTQGKYLAGLEGDDCWSDMHKLQKQVDFLEKHPEYYTCACRFDYIDEYGNPVATDDIPNFDKRYWLFKKNVFTMEDYLDGKFPSQGSTWVYHNYFLEKKDLSIIYKGHKIIGDNTSLLLLVARGDIYIMPDVMLHYRRPMSPDGDSWSKGRTATIFMNYEHLVYFSNLEEYAVKNIDKDFSMLRLKGRYFYRLVDNFLLIPTRGKWKCITNFLSRTIDKWEYIKIFIKALYLLTVYPSIRNMNKLDESHECFSKFDKNWSDFWKEAKKKKIVLYGAGGGLVDVIMQYYDKLSIEFVVDKSKFKQNRYKEGYKIYNVDRLKDMDPDNTIILITTGIYYPEISRDLEEMGFYNYYVYQIMERKKCRYKPLSWMVKDRYFMLD